MITNEFNIAELERQMLNVVRLGKILEVDHAKREVLIKLGENRALVPWPCDIGLNYIRWQPLRVGTQVVLVCSCGDLAQARIVGMLYTNDLPPPSTDEHVDILQFNDGSMMKYDSSKSEMTVKSVGNLTIKVDGDVTIDASQIALNGGAGVVTGKCVCAYTGKPHSDFSNTVTAGK
ncbi:phage baseplate assembly protein V [Algicola sagamiensis]|uniref:phage baseplate assembly protein V n=1 Tax=Algicola sagamiensis TaxID=163869 RepID=UPI0003651A3A|nr:phage baseplate assembly protein V [Algicola sagamiensis]